MSAGAAVSGTAVSHPCVGQTKEVQEIKLHDRAMDGCASHSAGQHAYPCKSDKQCQGKAKIDARVDGVQAV